MNPEQKPAVSKWLWITLVIVVLIGGGFFAWYYLMGPGKKVATTTTPTTTTTTTPTTTTSTLSIPSDWKTYTGEDFTIKYPNSYSSAAVKGMVDYDYYLEFAPTGTDFNALDFSWIRISKSTNATLIKNIGEGKTFDSSISDIQATTVNGLAATKDTYNNVPLTSVWFVKNNAIYSFEVVSIQSDKVEILNQMLSTFAFTN